MEMFECPCCGGLFADEDLSPMYGRCAECCDEVMRIESDIEELDEHGDHDPEYDYI